MNSKTILFIIAKKYYLLALVIIIFGSVGLYKYFHKAPVVQTITVSKGEFLAKVSVTGKVVPVQSVDLAFNTSGRISHVYKNVGDKVSKGEVIASLNSSSLQANLDKANADLAGEQEKLNQLQNGNSQATEVTTVKQKLMDSILDGFTTSDDAIRNKTDQFFTDADTMNPKITFAFNDYDLKEKINNQRIVIEETLQKWSTLNLRISTNNITTADAETARVYLTTIKSFLDDVSRAVNNFETNNTLSQTEIDKYKNDTALARANVNNALSALTTAEDGLRGTASDKSVQETRVESAQATVSSIEAELSDMSIRSPLNGVVTAQNAKEGEIANVNKALVSVISSSNFQIEAYIPEADIAKVKVGQPADVTLDAYGNSVIFKASVSYIDPAETMIEGVATYKTTLVFADADSRIKSGMTANTDIEVDKRENVITLPQRVVFEQDGEKIVTLKKGNQEVVTKIKTGKVDEKGDIEIVSGLSEGDVVVVK